MFCSHSKSEFLLSKYKQLVLVNFVQKGQSIDFTTIMNIDRKLSSEIEEVENDALYYEQNNNQEMRVGIDNGDMDTEKWNDTMKQ